MVEKVILNRISSWMMCQMPFDSPKLIGTVRVLHQKFSRFRTHVASVFRGPLSKRKTEEKVEWLGTWIGPQGRQIYKTLQWGEGEKENPVNKLEAYVRPPKNKCIRRKAQAEITKTSHR